jgi:hypothetical protein
VFAFVPDLLDSTPLIGAGVVQPVLVDVRHDRGADGEGHEDNSDVSSLARQAAQVRFALKDADE